jgi:hypothetical protein
VPHITNERSKSGHLEEKCYFSIREFHEVVRLVRPDRSESCDSLAWLTPCHEGGRSKTASANIPIALASYLPQRAMIVRASKQSLLVRPTGGHSFLGSSRSGRPLVL